MENKCGRLSGSSGRRSADYVTDVSTHLRPELMELGPSLASSGIPAGAVLADPVLELHGSNGALIMRNDNWKDDQRALIEGTIYQPTDDRESVIVTTLPQGAYTAIVSGNAQTTGVGLV